MINQFEAHSKYFLDHMTVIYGETGSGKSFIIKDILYSLKDSVDQIIVISPSDISNQIYEKNLVPKPCIHYKITAELLSNIIQRQTALGAVYERANRFDILSELFNKIPDIDNMRKFVAMLYDKIQTNNSTDEIEREKENNKYNELIAKTIKKCVYKHRDDLKLLPLSEDEIFTLTYFDINPRLVLVLDDCTEYLKKYKSNTDVQSMFYRGRWGFLSIIIACHTDKALDPELKKNVHISIYTGKKTASAYFNRSSADIDDNERVLINQILEEVFSSSIPYQKLVWVREENKYYKYTARPRNNFRFGSPKLWEFCDMVKAPLGQMNTSNKFIQDFIS